jgi:hypothetical protein
VDGEIIGRKVENQLQSMLSGLADDTAKNGDAGFE